MKYFINLFILFFAFSITLLAQEDTRKLIDEDKDKYETDVFNKEFVEDEDSLTLQSRLYDRIPEKLPDWVFEPIVVGSKTKVVGFSDPGMEKNDALQLATIRAKAIYAIFNSSKVSNITDDYTNLQESGKYSLYSTKFQDFSLTKTEFAYCDSAISIVDTFYTKYNEGIVLIEIDNDKLYQSITDTLTVQGEHLQVFIERNFRKEKIEFFNFFAKNANGKDSIDLITQYNFKRVNSSYDISSMFGDSVLNFEERIYSYRSEIEFQNDSTNSELNYFSLSRGLWNGYVSGLMSNITVLSKQLASQVKNSNDFYTLKSEGLIRTVARNRLSLGFNKFEMIENHFYFDLNGIIQHP